MIMRFIEYNNIDITIAIENIQDTASQSVGYNTASTSTEDSSVELTSTAKEDLETLLYEIVDQYASKYPKYYLNGFYVESNNKLEMPSKAFSSFYVESNNLAKPPNSFNNLYVESNNLAKLSNSFNSLHRVNPPDKLTQLRFDEVMQLFIDVGRKYRKFTDNVNYIFVNIKFNDAEYSSSTGLLKELLEVYKTAKTIIISLDTGFQLSDAQKFTAEKDAFICLENYEIILNTKKPNTIRLLNSEDKNSYREALQLIEDKNSHREASQLNEYKNSHREALQLIEDKNSYREALQLNEYKNSYREASQLIEDENSNSETSQLIDELTEEDLKITEDTSVEYELIEEVVDYCCTPAWYTPCAII